MLENYRSYLPSAHFIRNLLVCVAVVGLVLLGTRLIARGKEKRASVAAEQKLAQERYNEGTLVAISDLAEKDTDSDGLPDWEEALWGTDPNNKDTDGNGISDKNEVDEKKASVEAASGVSGDTGDLTETEAFSRELFASIAALKESGNLNDQSIKDLASTISENAGEKQIITASYTTADIKMTGDSTTEITNYRTTMTQTLAKYDNSGIGKELIAIDAALSSEADKDKLGELYAVAKAYRALAKDLTLVAVPQAAASMHLDLINSANNTGIALDNIPQIYDNALGGLIGLAQYDKESGVFEQKLRDLQDYFIQNGIIR